MTEMVERVMSAMAETLPRYFTRVGDEAYSEDVSVDLRVLAVAAITAMREPCEAQKVVVVPGEPDDYDNVWRHYIDAALGVTPERYR